MGKIIDVLSLKLHKHGYLAEKEVKAGQISIYRMNSKNLLPYFGHFPYTPMYIYIRKSKINPTQIEEIRTIKTSPSKDGFLKELGRTAKLGKKFNETIKIDRSAQMQKF